MPTAYSSGSIAHFSGSRISDTYQRVVQTDGTYLADGTGSLLSNLIIPGNLTIDGTLYAKNQVIVTQSYSSGSNQFGDNAEDTQTLFGTVNIPTGSLITTGSLRITGSVSFTGSLDVLGDTTFVGSVIINGTLSNTINSGSLNSGSSLIYSLNTGSYTAGFFDYYVTSGSNGRSGTIMSHWLSNQIQYTDNSAPDIGSTANLIFSMSLADSTAQLFVSASSLGWNIKTTFRAI